MKTEDLEEVVAIEREAFSNPWSAGAFLSELKNPFSRALVWEENEKVKGYILWRSVLGEVHILNLAVAKDSRRKGIASALLQSCMESEGQASYFVLEVRKSNQAAIRLYRKHGFRVVAEIRGYYSFPKEDALVMARSRRKE